MKNLQLLLSQKDELLAEDLTFILFGHAAFQYLNAACELGVFEILYDNPGTSKDQLAEMLQLNERPMDCLMLGLGAMKLIVKDENVYYNANLINEMIAKGFWKVIKHTTKFEAEIVYAGQKDFVESLRADTNIGLRRIPEEGEGLYNKLNKSPLLFDSFYNYMSTWSEMSLPILLNNVDFSAAKKVLDVGGGDATMAVELCKKYPEMDITILEIPGNSSKAKERIAKNKLQNRISIQEGDMFIDEFPGEMDCVLFIHQLVIWNREKVTALLKKAHAALKKGGYVVIFNSFTADDESGPLMGALDSVYFVSIPADGGMIYAWRFYEECLAAAGFSSIERSGFLSSWSPHGYIKAFKG
jgi:ubiquinone/menaquinone biosynthesis C-methylase UbiE